MKPEEAIRAGEQAEQLLKKDKTKLEGRLEPAVIDGITEDTATLSDRASKATTARAQRSAATQKQNVIAKRVCDRVIACRSALQKTAVPKEVLKAAGVGKRITSKSVKTALEAGDMVVEAYAKYPEEMRAAGLLPADMDTIVGLGNALRAADLAQEGQKVVSTTSTAQRKAAQQRLEQGLMKVIAAAELEFVESDPARVAQYQALIPARPKRKKPAAG